MHSSVLGHKPVFEKCRFLLECWSQKLNLARIIHCWWCSYSDHKDQKISTIWTVYGQIGSVEGSLFIVRLWFWVWQKWLDLFNGSSATGVHKAVMTDLHEAIRENMLQEPANKFDNLQGHSSGSPASFFKISEGHFSVFDLYDPAISNSHLEDIGSEIG